MRKTKQQYDSFIFLVLFFCAVICGDIHCPQPDLKEKTTEVPVCLGCLAYCECVSSTEWMFNFIQSV